MNLLKSKFRRTRTVAAGTFLGLVGMMATAAPAMACHTYVTGKATCVTESGDWVVKWEIKNSEKHLAGEVKEVNSMPTPVTGIGVGSPVPKQGEGVLTGEQTVPKSERNAKLSVLVRWDIGHKGYLKKNSGKVSKPRYNLPKCQSPSPSPSVSQSESPSPSPSPSDSSSPTPSPSDSSTPPTKTPPTSVPPTSPVTEPQFVYENDCDTFTVGIEVPASWPEDVTVTFTPSTGEPKTVVGKVGETTTVDFPASENLKITATPEGYEDEAAEIAYEAPEDCDTDGEGGGLPVTGAAAGGIAGGAAALLGLGALLFFLARRRKVNFTA